MSQQTGTWGTMRLGDTKSGESREATGIPGSRYTRTAISQQQMAWFLGYLRDKCGRGVEVEVEVEVVEVELEAEAETDTLQIGMLRTAKEWASR